MELDNAIQSIKEVKHFADKKPDFRDIIEAIDKARYASMAGDNYTLKFILIENEKTISNITSATQQHFISEAKYLVVVCSDPSRLINAYGKAAEEYNKHQVGAAIQNFLLSLNEKKLKTKWIRLFIEEEIKKELKIPEKINVEALFPIGYESKVKGENRMPKQPIDLDRILFFDQYENKKMKEIKTLEV